MILFFLKNTVGLPLRRFESAKHARTLDQRLAQVREACEQAQTAKGSDYRDAGQTVSPAPNLKRVLLDGEPAKKRRRTGHVSHKTSEDDGHEITQSDTDEPHPLQSANKNKKSKSNTQASGGAEAKELRRSSRMQAKKDDNGYAGSETPAETRKRQRGAKEAPDKYIPCKICNKWDCDNMSNQMLICDGCDGYYHRKCISARHMPKSAFKWLCHSCIKKGILVEVMRKDMRWHRAVVTEQHPPEVGTELLFDTGETDLLDLNTQRWRPYSVSPLNVLMSASEELEDAARGMVGIPVIKEPKTFNSLKHLPPSEQAKWRRSMEEEWQSIVDKDVMHTVWRNAIPSNAKVLPLKWVYKIKSCGRYKSRLVALGNLMDDSTMDTESPTPSLTVVRTLFSLAAKRDWDVQIIDVDTAFLNAAPSETVYVSLPQGYSKPGQCALLLKSLYGTSNAPKSWNTLLHNWMITNGFKPNPHEPCLYTGTLNGSKLHLLVHVDDVSIFGETENCVKFKALLRKTFDCKDEELVRYLGFNVKRTKEGFIFDQTDLIGKLSTRAGRCKGNTPVKITPIRSKPKLEKHPLTPGDRDELKQYPYRSHLGVTGYVTVGTRNDGAFAYKTLASFNDCHGTTHRKALDDFIGYLAMTADSHTLKLSKGGGDYLVANCDADWNGTLCHRSTTGWIIFHGTNPISWASRTQKCTARSTGEAEYIALSSLAQECVYIKMLLESLDERPGKVGILSNEGTEDDPGCVRIWQDDNKSTAPIKIWSDSLNAVQNSKKEWVSDKLRHIKTAYHFFKQYVKSGDIDLQHISGPENCADIFTKGYGECAYGAANQMAAAYQKHALKCLGHVNCGESCTCRLATDLSHKVGEKRKTFESRDEHAATAAKKFRKAAEAANLCKRKRTTKPVGKPNVYEEWDSSELRFSD